MTAAGERSTPVVLLRPVTGDSGAHNNDETTWEADPVPYWTRFDFRRGREFYADGALVSQDSARFTFDWMDAQGITSEMRIECQGKVYNIKAIDPDLDLRRHVVVEAIAGLQETQR